MLIWQKAAASKVLIKPATLQQCVSLSAGHITNNHSFDTIILAKIHQPSLILDHNHYGPSTESPVHVNILKAVLQGIFSIQLTCCNTGSASVIL